MDKTSVAVIFGGTSSERAVSICSGQNVIKSLPRDRYEVTAVEILADGSFRLNNKTVKPAALQQFDVAFIALHGAFGEDGQIQKMLDNLGVRYTGSGATASQLAFDKYRASEVVQQAGLLIPRQQQIESTHVETADVKITLPLVVKPNENGSSVGVTIVKDERDLAAALQSAAKEGETVVIQEFIAGRELTCGVLGDLTLPSVEIISGNEFFDYDAKYHSKNTREDCPANLTAKQEQVVQLAAKTAHHALGCAGLTRSDFILTPDDRLYYLETNTIPGMTDISLCPKEAAAAGISMSEFLSQQVEMALL